MASRFIFFLCSDKTFSFHFFSITYHKDRVKEVNMKINSFKGTILAKRLAVIVSMTIAGTLLSPILVKLQGAHLTAVVVSIFATAKLAGGLLQPLMLKLSLYKVFWLLFVETITSIITIMIYVLGYIPEHIFVVAMLILGVLDGIFGCAYLFQSPKIGSVVSNICYND